MKKIICAAACLLAFVATPAHAWLEVEGSWWFMQPSGNLNVGIAGLQGSTLDLQNDLGYGGRIGVPDVRVVFGKYVEFGAEYFKLSMSADNTIQRTVQFNDLVFPIDADVASSLDATFIRGFARVNIGPEEIHGGILGGGQYMDFSARASSPQFGSTEKDVQTGMPYVGAFLEASPLEWLTLRASVCGFKWGFSNITAKFIDAEASLVLKYEFLYAGGGYRYIYITGEDSDYPVTADLRLSGPVVYAGVRW